MINLIQCLQNENQNVSVTETLDEIKNAGFNGVFIQWYGQNLDLSPEEQFSYCLQKNLSIENFHLGYSNIKHLWLDDEIGEKLVEEYINDLKDCKKFNVNTVVMHLTKGGDTPAPNQIGIDRLKKIISVAENLKIKIALENKRDLVHINYVFDNIQSPYLGVCFDSGHCHCHMHDNFDWTRYKNKIFAIHLHDNDFSSDQHKIPFDGNINWFNVLKNLFSSHISFNFLAAIKAFL